MELTKQNLHELRQRFDSAVEEHALSASSVRRYQLWIKRYLRHCRSWGLELSLESAKAFLQSYENISTARQGYYSLKFLFSNVMNSATFPSFCECGPPRRSRSERWLRWWRNFRKSLG